MFIANKKRKTDDTFVQDALLAAMEAALRERDIEIANKEKRIEKLEAVIEEKEKEIENWRRYLKLALNSTTTGQRKAVAQSK